MPLLSEIRFASLLIRSKEGAEEIVRNAFNVSLAIKQGKPWVAKRVLEVLSEYRDFFADFLGPNVVLVPAPGSEILYEGASWPMRDISHKLLAGGFGSRAETWLKRTITVPKSHRVRPEFRPTAQRHYETIDAVQEFLPETKITVVDDIITRGRTTLACVSLLQERYPEADIRAFAFCRHVNASEVDRIIAPCNDGKVTLESGDCFRRP
jgi:hypothetical protein